MLFVFRVCLCPIVLSVSCSLGEGRPFDSLVCDVFCDFVTFPYGVLCQMWCLIISIPDLCPFPYL